MLILVFELSHSFATKNEIQLHEKAYKKKDFCRNVLLTQINNTLEFN